MAYWGLAPTLSAVLPLLVRHSARQADQRAVHQGRVPFLRLLVLVVGRLLRMAGQRRALPAQQPGLLPPLVVPRLAWQW